MSHQQQQWALLVFVLVSAVLLPRTACISGGGGGHASTVSAFLTAMQDPAVLGTADTYQQLMAHQHTLSQGHLERSLAYMGSNLRLRRLLARLMSPMQQHFHIGVIGGSISWGHGVQRGTQDWFSLLQLWMEATFPQHRFTFKNGCVPATQSSYVSSCLQQFVDADADLVLVEYVTNDGYHHGSVDNSLVRSFERLLRKLLNFGRAPAVVLLEFLATDVKVSKLPFYATGEDQYGVLAQYYSIPWLSYRDAVWHEYFADTPGFKRYEIFPVGEERHPTPLGHRYLADMVIHLLQQTYLDSLLNPMGDLEQLAKEPAMQVPAPMFTGNWESSNLICVVGEALPHTVLQNEGWQWVNEGTALKPKWGFVTWQVGARLVLKVDTRASAARHSDGAGGVHQQQQAGEGSKPAQASKAAAAKAAGNSNSQGHLAAALPAAAATTGGPDSTPQHATAAPALKTLVAPPRSASAAPASAAKEAAEAESEAEAEDAEDEEHQGNDLHAFAELAVPDMIVWVGYVRSWRHMGAASFNCIQGCKCQGTTVDALHDLGNTQQHMVKLYTTEAAECLIEVKVNPWSRTKEHKFKVTAVMVTHAVEYSGHGDFTDSVLLDNINPPSSTSTEGQHQQEQQPAGQG